MEKERIEELLVKAFEHSIEVSKQATHNLINATKITSNELEEIGYEKENFPEMHEWAKKEEC